MRFSYTAVSLALFACCAEAGVLQRLLQSPDSKIELPAGTTYESLLRDQLTGKRPSASSDPRDPLPCVNHTLYEKFDWLGTPPGSELTGIGHGVWLMSEQYRRVGPPFTVYAPKPSDPFYANGTKKAVLRFRSTIYILPGLSYFLSFNIPKIKIYPVNPEVKPENLVLNWNAYDGGNGMSVLFSLDSWGEIDLKAIIDNANLPWYEGFDYGLGLLEIYLDWNRESQEEYYVTTYEIRNRCDAKRYMMLLPCAEQCESNIPWVPSPKRNETDEYPEEG